MSTRVSRDYWPRRRTYRCPVCAQHQMVALVFDNSERWMRCVNCGTEASITRRVGASINSDAARVRVQMS